MFALTVILAVVLWLAAAATGIIAFVKSGKDKTKFPTALFVAFAVLALAAACITCVAQNGGF